MGCDVTCDMWCDVTCNMWYVTCDMVWHDMTSQNSIAILTQMSQWIKHGSEITDFKSGMVAIKTLTSQ